MNENAEMGRTPAVRETGPGADIRRPDHFSIGSLVSRWAIYEHRTHTDGFYARAFRGGRPERPAPSPAISQLADSLELTEIGRDWFLASQPQLVAVTEIGNQLALPDSCLGLNCDGWRNWWQRGRTRLEPRLDLSLRGHFVDNLVGTHWPDTGRIEIYDSPLHQPGSLKLTAFHELLHAVHAVMPSHRRQRLYGDLAQLLCLPDQTLSQKAGLDRADLSRAMAKAGQRWQRNSRSLPVGYGNRPAVDPDLVDQFLAGIDRDSLGRIWLPDGLLHERVVVAMFDEAYAHIGDNAGHDLGAFEAHYRPYCRQRAQMVSRWLPSRWCRSPTGQAESYLAELQQLVDDDSRTENLTTSQGTPATTISNHAQQPGFRYLSDCLAIIRRLEADLGGWKPSAGEAQKQQLEYCLARAKFLFYDRLGFGLRLPW